MSTSDLTIDWLDWNEIIMNMLPVHLLFSLFFLKVYLYNYYMWLTCTRNGYGWISKFFTHLFIDVKHQHNHSIVFFNTKVFIKETILYKEVYLQCQTWNVKVSSFSLSKAFNAWAWHAMTITVTHLPGYMLSLNYQRNQQFFQKIWGGNLLRTSW